MYRQSHEVAPQLHPQHGGGDTGEAGHPEAQVYHCQTRPQRRKEAGLAVADVVGGLETVRSPRVLLRTGSFRGFYGWNADFAGIEPALVDALADRGVITIGIDTPSVDPQESKELPAHKAIFRRGIAILEGLDLAEAPAGSGRIYELIAPPLRLMGCDASPVRALLREMP